MRQVAGTAARVASRVGNVCILLFLHLLVFAVGAEVLFSGLPFQNCTPVRMGEANLRCSTFIPGGCSDYFNSVEESMVHLFALLTGANFPAVILPAMACNAWSAWFFVLFILIGVYLLLMLALAVTSEGMASLSQRWVLKRYERLYEGCNAAFLQLTSPGDADKIDGQSGGRTDSEQPAEAWQVGQPLVLPRDELIGLWALVAPHVSEQVASKLFSVFDSDGRGAIDCREFRRLVSFAHVRAARSIARERVGMLSGGAETVPSRGSVGGGAVVLSPLAGSLSTEMVVGNPFSASGRTAAAEEVPADIASFGGSGPLVGDSAASSRATRVNAMRSEGAVGASSWRPEHAAEAQSWGTPPPNLVKARAAQFGPPQGPEPGKVARDARAARWATLKRVLIGGLPGPLPVGVSSSSARGRLLCLLHAAPASLLFDFALVTNSAAVLWQLLLTNTTASNAESLRLVQWVMIAIAAVEAALKVCAWGPRAYAELSLFNAPDAVVVTASVITYALEGQNVMRLPLRAAISFLRTAKVLQPLSVLLPGFGLALAAAGDTLRAIGWQVAVLLCVLYSFAIVGETAFTGALDLNNPAVAASSYGVASRGSSGAYRLLHFDSLRRPSSSPRIERVAGAHGGYRRVVRHVGPRHRRPACFLCPVRNDVCWFLLNTISAFTIESFRVSKAEREAAARATSGTGVGSPQGAIEDFAALVACSGVDFTGWTLTRPRQQDDVYSALHRAEVLAAHADTLPHCGRASDHASSGEGEEDAQGADEEGRWAASSLHPHSPRPPPTPPQKCSGPSPTRASRG